MGGLDDFIPKKPNFSARVILIAEVPVSSYDNLYAEREL